MGSVQWFLAHNLTLSWWLHYHEAIGHMLIFKNVNFKKFGMHSKNLAPILSTDLASTNIQGFETVHTGGSLLLFTFTSAIPLAQKIHKRK